VALPRREARRDAGDQRSRRAGEAARAGLSARSRGRARTPVATLAGVACALALAVPLIAGAQPQTAGQRDVRSFGARCDGASDDAAAFQSAYDALTAAPGSSIVVLAGARCAIGGDGVTPKSGVGLRCEPGAQLRALPGARAMFRTTATLDDWSVSGCDFDLNGVAVPAWESSGGNHGGARWTFRDNVVHGMPATAGAPLSSVRLDCTLASGPCLIAHNTIFGSDTAQRRDTCLTVTAGGYIGFNTQVLGNYLQGCGGSCLEARRPGGITANDNVLVRCHDSAVDNSSLNSVWSGNQLGTIGAEAGATMSIHDTIGNQVIVGNQLAVNPSTKAPSLYAVASPHAKMTGVYLDADYAAQGVFFDAKGACAGGSCAGELCDDDGGCGSCGGRCADHGVFDHDHVAHLIVTGDIRIENATNLIVQGNIVLGTAGADAASSLRLVNPRSDGPSGAIVISNNQLSKRAPETNDLACIEIDDAGGGGFAGLTITGNACGQDRAIAANGTPAHGIKLTRPPHAWRSVLIADNNLANARDPLVGFDDPAVRAATALHGNLGVDAVTPAAGGVVLARTRSDRSRSAGGPPESDPELRLTLAPGKAYALDGVLRLHAAGGGAALAGAFAVPAGATISVALHGDPTHAESGALLAGDATAAVPLAPGDNLVTLAGTVGGASQAGALELRWGQVAGEPAPLVLQSGSWLRAMELP
jgi:hypothetical protein